MKILFVSPYLSYPMTSGGHTRVYHLLRQLCARHAVDLICLVNREENAHVRVLEKICRRVEAVVVDDLVPGARPFIGRNSLGRLFLRLGLLLRGVPWEASGFYFPEFKKRLARLMKQEKYDALHVEHPRMALHIPRCVLEEWPGVRVVGDQDLSYMTPYRRFKNEQHSLKKFLYYIDFLLQRSFAKKTWNAFNHLVVMSEVDAARVKTELKDLSVQVIPNGADLDAIVPVQPRGDQPRILLLGGSGHFANVDGYHYFRKEFWPEVKRACADVELMVAGQGWEQIAGQSADPSVKFPGFIENLSEIVSSRTVLAVPLRLAGGTRLKILEAMAMGVPVITTAIGCEGIPAENGKQVMLFSSAAEFVRGFQRLCDDPRFYQNIKEQAYDFVKKHFNWRDIAGRLERVYGQYHG